MTPGIMVILYRDLGVWTSFKLREFFSAFKIIILLLLLLMLLLLLFVADSLLMKAVLLL